MDAASIRRGKSMIRIAIEVYCTLRRFRGLIVAIHPQDALNERFGLLW
jgi:hypothetical protein